MKHMKGAPNWRAPFGGAKQSWYGPSHAWGRSASEITSKSGRTSITSRPHGAPPGTGCGPSKSLKITGGAVCTDKPGAKSWKQCSGDGVNPCAPPPPPKRGQLGNVGMVRLWYPPPPPREQHQQQPMFPQLLEPCPTLPRLQYSPLSEQRWVLCPSSFGTSLLLSQGGGGGRMCEGLPVRSPPQLRAGQKRRSVRLHWDGRSQGPEVTENTWLFGVRRPPQRQPQAYFRGRVRTGRFLSPRLGSTPLDLLLGGRLLRPHCCVASRGPYEAFPKALRWFAVSLGPLRPLYASCRRGPGKACVWGQRARDNGLPSGHRCQGCPEEPQFFFVNDSPQGQSPTTLSRGRSFLLALRTFSVSYSPSGQPA